MWRLLLAGMVGARYCVTIVIIVVLFVFSVSKLACPLLCQVCCYYYKAKHLQQSVRQYACIGICNNLART